MGAGVPDETEDRGALYQCWPTFHHIFLWKRNTLLSFVLIKPLLFGILYYTQLNLTSMNETYRDLYN